MLPYPAFRDSIFNMYITASSAAIHPLLPYPAFRDSIFNYVRDWTCWDASASCHILLFGILFSIPDFNSIPDFIELPYPAFRDSIFNFLRRQKHIVMTSCHILLFGILFSIRGPCSKARLKSNSVAISCFSGFYFQFLSHILFLYRLDKLPYPAFRDSIFNLWNYSNIHFLFQLPYPAFRDSIFNCQEILRLYDSRWLPYPAFRDSIFNRNRRSRNSCR